MPSLCAPALIYLIFSLAQILIDTFKGFYNTALMKTFVMLLITFLLNILCQNGLGIISWIIVFIPFILMTVIVTMLLYIFGLDVATGTIHTSKTIIESPTIPNTKLDANGNIVIYDPYYNPKIKPVSYHSPNLIVPKPRTYPYYRKPIYYHPNGHSYSANTQSQQSIPNNWISSSPAYES